jgi:hypothetical protein
MVSHYVYNIDPYIQIIKIKTVVVNLWLYGQYELISCENVERIEKRYYERDGVGLIQECW